MVRAVLPTMFGILLVTACAPSDTDDNSAAGPCVHGYLEPVLSIETVTVDPSGANVVRVALSSFKVNGEPRDPEEWGGPSSTWSNPTFNITVTDGVLYCDLPCGFGLNEGVYEFVADAPNHETKSISVNAGYASFEGGCPSYSDNGTNVNFQLVES